jgi:hypothetical protein
MCQEKLDTLFKLKSDTQQPTPDKDKGDRDINVSEAISERPSSVASASAISKHGPPDIDAVGITLSNLSHIDKLNQLDAEWTDAHTFTFPSRQQSSYNNATLTSNFLKYK